MRRSLRNVLPPLAAGFALRALFVLCWPLVAGDALVYGNIAQTWLLHGVYGFSPEHSTLIRLPGYPAFLAACFAVFGVGHYKSVLWLQVVIDLVGCVLLSRFAARGISPRAGRVVLWLACLCPFTANYCAAPLTETLSIFCVTSALYCALRLTEGRQARWAIGLGAACGYAVLLRPDGALLPLAVLLGFAWVQRSQRNAPGLLRCAAIAALITVLPLVPWTIRNWHTFHVLQPLAPRYANDPGEPDEAGYKAWTATWFGDYVSNEEFYWNADDTDLDITKLPARAFDSADQSERTAALISDYNQDDAMSPEFDARFAALALERRHQRPLRTRVALPLTRLADMWLRPRTELLNVNPRWWSFRPRAQGVFALLYAMLNAALLLAALAGALRRRLPLGAVMLCYVLLRCALLLTLENAEPRYTLECYPMIVVAAGAFLAGKRTYTEHAGQQG